MRVRSLDHLLALVAEILLPMCAAVPRGNVQQFHIGLKENVSYSPSFNRVLPSQCVFMAATNPLFSVM